MFGYEIWALKLRGKDGLRVTENKLIRICVSKYSDDETDNVRSKHGAEVHTKVPYQNLNKWVSVKAYA
jgi:hypothetical protein